MKNRKILLIVFSFVLAIGITLAIRKLYQIKHEGGDAELDTGILGWIDMLPDITVGQPQAQTDAQDHEIINIVAHLPRRGDPSRRSLEKIEAIVVHTTAGPNTQTPQEIARYHIDMREFRTIGYHFLIARDGTIYQTLGLNEVGSNVMSYNTPTVGVSCIGHGDKEDFTAAQYSSLYYVIGYIEQQVGRQLQISGHRELQGRNGVGAKSCPGTKVMMTPIRQTAQRPKHWRKGWAKWMPSGFENDSKDIVA